MADKRPIFLFAFANDAEGSLRLGEEQNACWNELAALDQEGIIDCQRLGFATLKQVYREFNRFNDQIYLFHYGGHSDSEIIKFPGKEGSAENLGVLFGQQKKLKLVFLNGCKNYRQVELLFNNGVSAVIATNANVEDRRAIVLAQQFYQALAGGSSIRDAFESAKAYIFDKYSALKRTYRAVGFSGVEEEGGFSWGLYTRENSTLDWTIKTIETETQLDLLQKLRRASWRRHQKFTSENGRFRHLKIDEAILTDIRDIKLKTGKLIEDNITLNKQQQSLWQSLPQLWEESCPHAMITGPGGMGKTVSLIRLWERWVNTAVENAPVPIFIQLNEFNNRPEKNFIRTYIRQHFAKVDLEDLLKKPNLNAKGQKRPHVILLLDGLNEVTVKSNELLLEINQLKTPEDYPGVQLVLTSRVDTRAAYQWQAFHLLALHPLNDKQIDHYLQRTLPEDPRLLELLRNPMMLSIYAAQSELPRRYYNKGALKEAVASTGELLYNVEALQRIKIEELHSTAPSEQAYRRFVLEHLLPYLGWEMQQAGAFSVGEKEKYNAPGLLPLLARVNQKILNNNFFHVFKHFRKIDKSAFKDKEDWELLEEIIDQICCKELVFLVNENEEYRFLHQNFRDYFAARYVQNQMQIALRKNAMPKVFQLAPLDFYIRQLLGELEGEHTNKMTCKEGKWQWSKGQFFLENNLTTLLEQCRGVFDWEQLGYTVWNLLTIWKEHRGELSGADLRQLNFHSFSFNGLRASRPNQAACLSEGVLTQENLFSKGHSDWVRSTVYSLDGEHILTGSYDKTAKVWDAFTGQCLFTLEGHVDWVMSTAYSPDRVRILTGSSDKTAKVWDANTGQCLLTLKGHLAGVRSTVYSLDGEHILTGSDDKTAKVWDAHTGQCLLTLKSHSARIRSATYNPDGERILTGSDDKTAKVWDAHTGQCLLILDNHSAGIRSTAYSSDGKRILTGSSDKTVKVWDAYTGQCLLTLEGHSAGIESTVYSPDGERILTGSLDHTAKVWDAYTGQCLLTLEGHTTGIWSTAYSPDGDHILTGSSDKTAKVWDAYTGQCLLALEGHSAEIWSTAHSPDGKRILTGSGDNTAKVWDANTGQCLLTIGGHSAGVRSTVYSPDGGAMLTSSDDHTAKVWDANTGQCLMTLEGHSAGIRSTAFSPDGSHILTGSLDHTAKVWDAHTGQCLLILDNHSAGIRSTAYSSDGKRILTGSLDHTAKVWNAKTGVCLLTLEEHSAGVWCTAYSPDGDSILTSSDDHTAKVWDAKTGECLITLKGHSAGVWSIVYSPNGEHILTSSRDKKVKVWDAKTGACLLTLGGHSYWVMRAIYSPDGDRILTGSLDKTAKVWDAKTGECLLTLPNIPGLFIQGCDFRNLHAASKLSKEVVGLLRQYGGILSDHRSVKRSGD